MPELKMTQQNGAGGTGDLCLHAAAAPVCHRVEAAEPEKPPVSERDGESAVPAAVTVAAPDGGWGWVVLLATIVVMALTLAFPSCVGIFYTDLQNDFHASNSQTSWVPSIMTSALHAGGKALFPGVSFSVSFFGNESTGRVLLPGIWMEPEPSRCCCLGKKGLCLCRDLADLLSLAVRVLI